MPNPVLLIRANGNEDDAAVLKAFGFESVIDPYLEITLADSIAAVASAERMISQLEDSATSNEPTWLAITSANALKFLIELVGENRFTDAIKSPHIKFAAVGESSAAKLRELGAEFVLVPHDFNASSLARAITAGPPGKVVWPRSAIAMTTFPTMLEQSGWLIVDGPVYETHTVANEPSSAKDARDGKFSAVVFRSPSAAKAFAKYVSPATANLESTAIICLGETTAKAAAILGFVVGTSEPTISSAIKEVF